MLVIKQEMHASEESSLETKQKLSFLVRVKKRGARRWLCYCLQIVYV